MWKAAETLHDASVMFGMREIRRAERTHELDRAILISQMLGMRKR